MIPSGFDWRAELEKKTALQLEAFGLDATYTPPPSGTPVAFRAERIPSGEEYPEEMGTTLALFVRLSDFPSVPVNGGTVTIQSLTYKVARVDVNSQGRAVLTVRR